jgi:hypothetical protein
MMDITNGILLSGTVILGGIVLIVLWPGRRQKQSTDLEVSIPISLDELSEIWDRARKNGKVKIEDLAPIWREVKESAGSQRKEYSFKNEKIAAFFHSHIDQAPWFRKAPLQKEVCYQILLYLEKEGSCPSVVNAADDVEASWDSNTYTLLGKTTLLDHSLNVALEVIGLLTQEDAGHVIPDTLIAALGHDLGKLPSIKGHMYSLGEHPLAAGRVLADIPAFKQLARTQEISRAIKLHHKRPEGLLGETLKKADQLARQKELEWAVEQPAEENSARSIDPDNKIVQPESAAPPLVAVKTKESSSSNGSDAAWRAQADIYGEEEPQSKKKGEAPKTIDISAWFNVPEFLNCLTPYINRVNGRQFMSFSMANGYVYFQAKALEEVARQQAEQAGAMDVVTMAAGDPTMGRVLFTVVDQLRKNGLIARELIKDQYFGGYFTIITGGRAMKGFYTPFHAEAFGSIAKMEQQKTGILKNFKSVKPFAHKE